MKISDTSKRLREIMNERGLRQVDILRLASPYCEELGEKLSKSDLSQYCSGKAAPTQGKLFVLCAALDVSEAWLMGYDVSRERISDAARFAKTVEIFNRNHPDYIDVQEKEHLYDYRKLLPVYKKSVDEYTRTLLSVQDMELKAAHRRTDIMPDQDAEKHDIEEMDKF